jgi:hypothetical protein
MRVTAVIAACCCWPLIYQCIHQCYIAALQVQCSAAKKQTTTNRHSKIQSPCCLHVHGVFTSWNNRRLPLNLTSGGKHYAAAVCYVKPTMSKALSDALACCCVPVANKYHFLHPRVCMVVIYAVQYLLKNEDSAIEHSCLVKVLFVVEWGW